MDGLRVAQVVIRKILSQSATIHIYSFPHFTLETFLAIVMFIIYSYLNLEVSHIAKRTLHMKPNTISRRKLKVNSNLSVCSSFTHIHHEYTTFNVNRTPSTKVAFRRLSARGSSQSQLGWIMPQPAQIPPDFECIASLSPSEFVQRDKQKRIRERKMKKCFESLTTLYDNVMERKFSEKTLHNHIELAKESTECAKICSKHAMMALPCEAMTQSLFDLLEKIVIPSSISNPLPFQGDFTKIVLDAGNLAHNYPPNSSVTYLKKKKSSTNNSPAASEAAINIF